MKSGWTIVPEVFLSAMLLSALSCAQTHSPDGQEQEESVAGWTGFLPNDEVQVQGELIDIRTIGSTSEPEVFPQNENYTFSSNAVKVCGGNPLYAVSLVENPGPVRARAGTGVSLVVASDCENLGDSEWISSGSSFNVGDITYYLHRYVGTGKKDGVEIPRPPSSSHSCMVIAPKLKVNNVKNFGDCVIAKAASPRAVNKINNVNIIISPDGNYLASCNGADGEAGPVLFRSVDRGRTWERFGSYDVSANRIMNMYSFFVHKGALYMMGLGDKHKNLYISRSDDNGNTWTIPYDKAHGLILEGTFHSAQVPVLISQGRVWRSCEVYADAMKDRYPFVVSAPEDCDLLNGSNWTATNKCTNTTFVVNGCSLSGLTEGNMVEGPDGTVYNILRASSNKTSGYAGRLAVIKTDVVAPPISHPLVNLPGGGKKFTLRYDEVSRQYWTLTNPDTDYPADGKLKHAGMSDNLSHSLMRNRLVLLKSSDLVNWHVADDAVLYDPDPYFHGFQYVDWVFDGDDIIAVSRAGCPDDCGLPYRQHDANKMLFIRISNFRNK